MFAVDSYGARVDYQRVRKLLLLLPVAIVACRSIVDPPLPDEAEPFAPPPVYARWWAMTESCSGLTGSLANVSFYTVRGSTTLMLEGKQVIGYWSAGTNRIVIAEGAMLGGGYVRHEMLHALKQKAGHPRADFLDKCGGFVTCAPDCVAEGGPPPPVDANTPHVTAASLDLTMEIGPASPSVSTEGGVFSVILSAKNPADHTVAVTLSGKQGSASAFGYKITGANGALSGGVVALDPAVTVFAAGETKKQVFDFVIWRLGSGGDFPPGTYTVTGSYDIRGVSRTIVLSP
ncbi:MAG TPA: hypothetical protein VM099_14765 [Gemmatimonadaceae bacterium]|nr:hypothetical protein [Gemmatimonadaceae bacterium]